MTGDAPQPGETPRNEGNPWSYADPESPWWRGDKEDPATGQPRHTRPAPAAPAASAAATPTLEPPRPAQHTGEAATAHQAGAQDVTAALAGEPPQGGTAVFQVPAYVAAAEREAGITAVETVAAQTAITQAEAETESPPAAETKGVEGHHDQVDAERFNAEGDGKVYAARSKAKPEQEQEPTDESRAAAVPDVMILPEPDRNRPTVALDRHAVPGQPPSGLSRLGPAREDPARADRALQDRVRQERTSALLETSPFWQAEDRSAAAPPPAESREKVANTGRSPRRRVRQPRRPAAGLFGLLALGLIAAFFAWVSAEPFWLAAGHGDRGTATVARCTGSGVTQRCAGQFTAADGAYRVDNLALLGVEPAQRRAGAVAPARMVSSESRQAYVGDTGVLVHLRWALSFVLVLLCGLGIAGLTGARRLDTARARRGALLISITGPLVLLAGFLFVAY